MEALTPMVCNRLNGGSIRDCDCRLPGGGWAECPPAARAILQPLSRVSVVGGGHTGDACDVCGLFMMAHTGTCQTCQSCGSSSGGCS